MMPHYMWHGGGEKFESDGPNLRVHVYSTGRELHRGERVEGTISDVRADRQLFPLMRYFPLISSRWSSCLYVWSVVKFFSLVMMEMMMVVTIMVAAGVGGGGKKRGGGAD